MRRTVDMLILISVVVLLGVPGCSALRKSDSARFQGMWKGDEVGASMKGGCRLTVSGAHWEFRGGDSNEWYRGDFSLREDANPKQIVLSISECPAPQFIGKTSYGLYRFKKDTVTLAVNKPGDPKVPLSFAAPGTRQFVLKQQ